VAEPEIFVRMARDLAGGASSEAALAAVKEIGPAIELADLDPIPTPDNLDAVLAGDIFQRQVLLAAQTRAGGGTSGLTSRVMRRGAEMARTSDLEALTGKLPDIVALVANTLAGFGEKLAAGDIVITGSVIPPQMLEPDEPSFVHAVDPIGEVAVTFTRA
jgi:2-keto-4-pentenoate hydratase